MVNILSIINYIFNLIYPNVCGICDKIYKKNLCPKCEIRLNNLAKFNLTSLYLEDTGTLTGDIVSYFEQRRNTTPSGSMSGRFGYNVKFNGTQLPFINITYTIYICFGGKYVKFCIV